MVLRCIPGHLHVPFHFWIKLLLNGMPIRTTLPEILSQTTDRQTRLLPGVNTKSRRKQPPHAQICPLAGEMAIKGFVQPSIHRVKGNWILNKFYFQYWPLQIRLCVRPSGWVAGWGEDLLPHRLAGWLLTSRVVGPLGINSQQHFWWW